MATARLWPLFLAVAALGCGGEPPGPTLYPVQGTVSVEGKPVPEGVVQFRSNQAKGNNNIAVPLAAIQADGSFVLETDGKPGAPAGWYKVLVIADNFQVIQPPPSPVWPDYPEGFLPKTLVHHRYLRFSDTDLEVEVVPNPAEGAYVFKLRP